MTRSRGTQNANKQRAMTLIRANRLAEARQLFGEICRADRNDAEAWFVLGALNGQLGAIDDAIDCCRCAIALRPDYADAHYNLAQALMHQGRHREAVTAYQQVVSLRPDQVEARNHLGFVLNELGRYAEALDTLEHARRLAPASAEVHTNLGNALLGLGRVEEAIAAYRHATGLATGYVEGHFNLGLALRKAGRLHAARLSLERALALRPRYAEAHAGLGSVQADAGDVDAALESYRRAVSLKPDDGAVHSNLLFISNYATDDPRAHAAAHIEWAQRHNTNLPVRSVHTNSTDPERPLRIGYLSADFCGHPVGMFIEPVLAQHDRRRFEVFAYANVARPDKMTDRLKSLVAHWRDIATLDDDEAGTQIEQDGIDILVDLAGHTANNRLPVVARRPAPIQVSYLGYLNTVGMPSVDYRLTDLWQSPVGEIDALVPERLVRLDGGFLCFEPPPGAPVVGELPAAANGCISFGCFNNAAKLSAPTIALWSEILHAVAGSRLVLKSKHFADDWVRDRFRDAFGRFGVAPERVEFVGASEFDAYLQAFQRIDIALDPFPYNGGTVTCHALWMGVPVIALAGRGGFGRTGVSVLSATGLETLVAGSPRAYRDLAVALATDTSALADMRAGLRERLQGAPLLDRRRMINEIERAYAMMWRDWCQRRAAGA